MACSIFLSANGENTLSAHMRLATWIIWMLIFELAFKPVLDGLANATRDTSCNHAAPRRGVGIPVDAIFLGPRNNASHVPPNASGNPVSNMDHPGHFERLRSRSCRSVLLLTPN